MRADPATMIFGMRINVITSAVVFLGAVLYLTVARRGREEPETLVACQPVVVAS
jgi:phosphatidylglycerol---prolipoprotein diacylglyceryl transferase